MFICIKNWGDLGGCPYWIAQSLASITLYLDEDIDFDVYNIVDERLFLLAVIKYGIVFQEIKSPTKSIQKYMATRSMIAIEKGVDVYDSCYCHFDGYPDHNGKILKENYNTEQLVVDLIQGGDMSALKEKLEDVEYYTKRGEKLHVYENLSYKQLKKAAKDVGCEYIYIFFPDENSWGYTEVEDNFCSTTTIIL